MPRVVDAAVRRDDLVDATWRVVCRDGVDAATVRAVATEAGLSTGSLRHYFDSQSELLTLAMRRAGDQIRDRVGAVDWAPDPRREAERILTELLPLDRQREVESRVWLAFVTSAIATPGLRPLRDELDATIRQVCQEVVRRSPYGAALGRTERTVQVEWLYAVVDGLLIHRVLTSARTSPTLLRRVVATHLDRLWAADRG